EADGRLIGSRWGLNLDGVDWDASFVSGSGDGGPADGRWQPPTDPHYRANCPIYSWDGRASGSITAMFRGVAPLQRRRGHQSIVDLEIDYEDRADGSYQPLRPGDAVRIVVVNHASGYIG